MIELMWDQTRQHQREGYTVEDIGGDYVPTKDNIKVLHFPTCSTALETFIGKQVQGAEPTNVKTTPKKLVTK